jgi:hypothetical protein
MNSEEKLNHLFEALKAEKASTSVADVTSWIQASAQVTAPKSTSKIIIQKNFFIMSTIVTTLIVGGLLFLPGNKESKRTPLQNNTTKEAILDTSTSVLKQDNQIPVNKEFSENPFIQPLIDLGIEPLPFMEMDNGPAITQLDPIHSTQHSPITNNQSNTGSWFSSNDSLFVDTLFSGVKSLVFIGDKCDLLVRGSERSDVSMKYEYQLKAKGVFNRKNQGNCELSYERKDSVLTVHVKRKDQKFNGVSVLSETSKLEFYVPNNIDVEMNSDLGDIDVNGLKANTTKVYTALGDITAENVSGNIDLNTDLGDISMRKLEGKINSVTSLGDIDGEYILISDNSKFNTNLGDIDVQLSNPLSDCSLDLSSSLGKVKVDRPELKKKSGSQLNIGNGKLKVIMETSLGKVIVR